MMAHRSYRTVSVLVSGPFAGRFSVLAVNVKML